MVIRLLFLATVLVVVAYNIVVTWHGFLVSLAP